MLTRSISLCQHRITVADLKGLLTDAEALGATDETAAVVRVAPASNHPTDPGGEITISITITSQKGDS